jgi:ABC-type multidrug transport system ATPase subunit
VQQKDKHWPYLTARETLEYAVGLLKVADRSENILIIVNEIQDKLGLQTCAETKCNRLSGGQQRGGCR